MSCEISATPNVYGRREYAESWSEFGTPIELNRSGGWLLRRPIPGSSWADATGCYPLFSCRDWSSLGDDLEDLRQRDLVAVSLVADPFGAYDRQRLAEWFDVVIPFKPHYVVDLRQPLDSVVSRYHQRRVRRALSRVSITRPVRAASHLEEWLRLFNALVARHHLTGMKAFSRRAFEQQFTFPELVMFQASVGSELVAGQLWFVNGEVAYSHLQANSAEGYRHVAAFGLYWQALQWFADAGLRCADIGGSAGASNPTAADGLGRFKRGWATGTQMAYFCGRILDRDRYDALVAESRVTTSEYFPAYRVGEF